MRYLLLIGVFTLISISSQFPVKDEKEVDFVEVDPEEQVEGNTDIDYPSDTHGGAVRAFSQLVAVDEARHTLSGLPDGERKENIQGKGHGEMDSEKEIDMEYLLEEFYGYDESVDDEKGIDFEDE